MFPPEISAGVKAMPDAPRLSADDHNREANHRIANNLTVIAGLVRMHAADVSARKGTLLSTRDVRVLLDEIGSRIETVGRLHRLLSNVTPGERVDLGSHLRETAETLVASLCEEGDVMLSCKGAGSCSVDPDQAAPVALIVSELITNSIKHAHPAGAPGKISVRCGPGLTDSVYVEIEDDGVGLPDDFDPWSDGGLGFQVIRGLAQQLGARLIFDLEGLGMRVRLIVPTHAPA
jgi:two-component sensor histidine kinase